MKRADNLMSTICSMENLEKADHNARIGKTHRNGINWFDHWIKEVKKVKYYFRYADDITIFHESKEYLHKLLDEIRAYLEGRLLLRVKNNWQVFPVDARGVDFLGYVFYHDHILIRKRIKKNIIKKLLSCKRKGMEGKELHDAMGTYQGWMNYGNTKNLKYKLNNIGNGKVFK